MKLVSAALVAAQRNFAPALKSATNPHFKSKYADLAACVEAVIDALNSAGIALVQKQHPNEHGVSVETVFVHESGEMLSAGILSVPAAKQDPQGYGSALTYARRYSLMAACGIAPEDDDGNAAKAPTKHVAAGMAESVQAEWVAFINDSPTAGDMKKRLAEAVKAAMEVNDSRAVDKFNAAATAKAATAKAKATA